MPRYHALRRMLRASIVLALVLPAASWPRPVQAVTHGEIDSKNQHPNVGAIVVIQGPSGEIDPFIFGSGVLIHPRVLLTAGHVTARAEELIESGAAELDDARISFGAYAFDPETWLEIEAVVTHPDFTLSPEAHSHDLGVVILKQPVEGIPCAMLAYEGLLDDLKDAGLLRRGRAPERFLGAGYGATSEFPPPRIEEGDGWRRFVETDFQALETLWLVMNKTKATENGGAGYGDSGGPRFWTAPNDEQIVVAITSRGDPQLVAHDKAYRIDIPPAREFIHEILDRFPD